MPEENGNEASAAFARLKARVDGHDTDLAALRSIVSDLSDAMLVQARIEKRQSELIDRTAEGLAEAQARDRRLDDRVADLVSSIAELIRRIPPDNLRA
jgi:hypothetical protein